MSPFMLAGWGCGGNQPKGQFIWSQRLIELLFVSDIKAIPLAPGVLYDAWPIAHWESYCSLNNFILKSYTLCFFLFPTDTHMYLFPFYKGDYRSKLHFAYRFFNFWDGLFQSGCGHVPLPAWWLDLAVFFLFFLALIFANLNIFA